MFGSRKTLYVTILICEENVKCERRGFMHILGELYKFEGFGSITDLNLAKSSISVRE